MKFNGFWTALGVAVLGIPPFAYSQVFDNGPIRGSLFITGSALIVFGFLRAIWLVVFDLSGISRRAGEMAARGAIHLDTFKEAFKGGGGGYPPADGPICALVGKRCPSPHRVYAG